MRPIIHQYYNLAVKTCDLPIQFTYTVSETLGDTVVLVGAPHCIQCQSADCRFKPSETF